MNFLTQPIKGHFGQYMLWSLSSATAWINIAFVNIPSDDYCQIRCQLRAEENNDSHFFCQYHFENGYICAHICMLCILYLQKFIYASYTYKSTYKCEYSLYYIELT
jgi:hypothetical protein